MTIARAISERIRTATILLSGMIPFALQPGPVVGQPIAERQVDRLLDEFPESDGELPQEVALQCHLISMVSDAVTLRATHTSPRSVESGAKAAVTHIARPEYPTILGTFLSRGISQPTLPGLTDEQPQGP